ncbi:MAG: SEC-C domain-containing protein [Bacilli bacterium]|nr:SEC-C domain-containing protein [Bacilli bacterium]
MQPSAELTSQVLPRHSLKPQYKKPCGSGKKYKQCHGK